ncbi:MAG TPA: GNAT family N-acetyltransferase [Oscillospiraceae bacterium]|nr:GNAT family N-acetyltransferase [Oscillospiraceae bacterium]
MKKVENLKALNFFEKDMSKNLYICDNLVNAGKSGYAVKTIHFYTSSGQPSYEYISFSENVFNELIVEINTDNADLISLASKKIKNDFQNYSAVKIGNSDTKFFDTDLFKNYFTLNKLHISEYGVFANYSCDDIPKLELPDNIKIEVIKNLKNTKHIRYSTRALDGLKSIIKHSKEDDLLFIVLYNNAVAGYLAAGNSYKNVYDIINVFISPKQRGKSLGTFLTIYFSNYCYNNGFIPFYGTAVSKYSKQVAIKSGYTETSRVSYAEIALN